MSGDLWVMARNGTTLLPSEVKKLAADYDRLREELAGAQNTAAVSLQAMHQLRERLTLREEQQREAAEMVNRYERILAALREPSDAVLEVAALTMHSCGYTASSSFSVYKDAASLVRAAVAAAEKPQ